MQSSGIYTWWYYFRKGEVSGQVATLITLAIAVIFLFVAVTLNITRVSQRKTATAKAADGAAMKLASYIGSYANKLSWEYFGGGTKKCQSRWGTFFAILAVIVLVVIAPYLAPTLQTLAYIGAVVSGVSAALNEFVFEPAIAARMQRQLNKLSVKSNLAEQAVMYALRAVVDDPAKVTDIHDYDEDGDTTDKIMRFSQWYAQRVNALVDAAEGQRTQIASFIPQIEEFAQGADSFRLDYTEDATRPLVVEGEECSGPDCPIDDESIIVTAEEDGEFITLLQDLDNEGIEVSFWRPGADSEQNTDEVDELSGELNSFYLWALGEQGGLLNQDFDNIVRMQEMWIGQLYSQEEPDPEEGGAWYDTWQEQAARIDSWRPELYGIINQLDEMIAEETDPLRQDYLRDLQERASSAINTLGNFQDTLRSFNTDILVFYNQSSEDLDDERKTTYSWHDSLGWHHVHVEVSKFKMPYIKVKKHFMKICIYLKAHSGDITVKVARFDESTAASFARRRSTPLWKFRYLKDAQAQDRIDPSNPRQALNYGIKSEARAHYTYSRLPYIRSVK